MLYQLCDKDPSEFWYYTPAETAQMIDVKIKDRELRDKNDLVRRADLKCAMMNAAIGPYLKKREKFPYRIEDFLPKDILQKKPVVVTEAEKSKRWAAAGAAMMKVVREHERETGVRV